MALVSGARFLLYAAGYRRRYSFPHRHGPVLAPAFALLVSLFGIVIVILLLASQ
jgi:hypothetical protein